jgi:hypothetical protein
MSVLEDIAEGLSSVATFCTCALGTALLSLLFMYPVTCKDTRTGIIQTQPGDLLHTTCTNAFGGTPMSQENAAGAATLLGLALGGVALALRAVILDHAEQRRRAAETTSLGSPRG